jgi:Trk K+ transport system NAD-binding subunit
METNAQDPDGRETREFVDHAADATRVVIVGGGQVGRRLAEQLAPDHPVHHVDENSTAVARPRGYETSHVSDVTRTAALATTGVTAGDVAVVLAGGDSRTLLVTQLLRTTFEVDRVYAVLTDPRNRDAFDIGGVRVVCGTAAAAEAVLATTADVVAFEPPSVGQEDAATDVSNTLEPG